jgi:hypothetical protein
MDISAPPQSCFLGMTEVLIVIFGGAFLRERCTTLIQDILRFRISLQALKNVL